METIIANMPVDVNEQGYLLDMNQWNKAIARQIASEEEIDLADRHWEVLEYLHFF